MIAELNVFDIVANTIYFVLAAVALWGAYCVVMVWARVAQKRFRSEDAQSEFLDALDEPMAKGDFDGAGEMLEGDPRAISQLALLAIVNRRIGFTKVRQLLLDRFQRDVLADLEYRLSWVNTVIKSAPMVGLFGTVIGMMGAFSKLATAENVKPEELADNISVALITTACGLAIAIPLILCTAYINIRIRRMEELVGAGLSRFLESFRAALHKSKAGKV
jgi:biopolymer transport protein ExbB/TolQ